MTHSHDVNRCINCMAVAEAARDRNRAALDRAITEWEGYAAESAARAANSSDALRQLDRESSLKDAAMLRGLKLAKALLS